MKLSKIALTTLLSLFGTLPVLAQTIGDVTSVRDVRDNQIQGFGLVVGLPNTGDRGDFSSSTLTTLIQKYGIKVPADVDLKTKNIAAVMVNATLPPFAKNGQRLDITISSLGDAKSLRGGTLITTPLRGLDGKVYAISQGQILVDGASATGMDGSTLDINSSSVGRVPSGATVENELDYSSVFKGATYTLNLDKSSFALASNISKSINKTLGDGTAKAVDAGSVVVTAPKKAEDRIDFISLVDTLDVELPEPEAKVVVNSRTGTVMFTQNVALSPVAISIGNIVINVSEGIEVSQPNALAGGDTTVTANSQVSIERTQSNVQVIKESSTLNDLVQALNTLETAPKDMASIIQLLSDSGALKAKVMTN